MSQALQGPPIQVTRSTDALGRAGEPAGPPRWYTHAYNRPGAYRLAQLLAPRLPRPIRRRVSASLGRRMAARFPREREAVQRNLQRVHPSRDAAWLEQAAARVFGNFGICFADLLSLNRGPASAMWQHVAGVDGQEPTRQALSRGRGCVCLTAHIGNWELAGRLLAPLGRRVHVVMAPEQDSRIAALLDRPEAGGVRFVRRDSPLVSVGLVSALRRGEVVAFQLDRPTGGRGDCELPFFDAPVAFPLGPFVLAAAAGAPIVPAFCVLDPQGDYRLTVETPIEATRGEERDALARAVTVLGRYVAAYSEQWFNFFDVWAPQQGHGVASLAARV